MPDEAPVMMMVLPFMRVFEFTNLVKWVTLAAMMMQEVQSARDRHDFLEFPVEIYSNDPEWIRPLDKDIEQVFDPARNKAFRHGEATRWLLSNEEGKMIGRIAAFINRKNAGKNDQPTGGIGFFECIDDPKAAHFMFNHCKKWLAERGMEAMDGPINFGERDRWWGLLVEGFYEPVYAMNYNPPYYRDLFESYGFQTYYEQFCFSLIPQDPIDPKFEAAYHRLRATGDYQAEHIKKNRIEKYAADFTTIYNKAWAGHGGGKEISYEQSLQIFKKMKPVMDESLVWFVYYKDEPVACWLNLPELNQYFRHMNGRFGWTEKLKFLWLKWTGTCHKFYGLVFGVVPEHQGKGVDGLMIWAGATLIRNRGTYDFMELQWIGDFNPKMISIVKALGTKKCRTLITYRKLFDDRKPYKRFQMLEKET